MTGDGIEPIIWKMWTVHEAYRRLGFSADDIWVASDTESVFMQLDTQGKRFAAFIDKNPFESDEALRKAWNVFIDKLGSYEIAEAKLQAVWAASDVRQRSASFVTALLNAGFSLPSLLN